jgi:hypothetical protein
MGQQLNKIVKRRRRKNYLARKKALAKAGVSRKARLAKAPVKKATVAKKAPAKKATSKKLESVAPAGAASAPAAE